MSELSMRVAASEALFDAKFKLMQELPDPRFWDSIDRGELGAPNNWEEFTACGRDLSKYLKYLIHCK
jgi:hypothetical protein